MATGQTTFQVRVRELSIAYPSHPSGDLLNLGPARIKTSRLGRSLEVHMENLMLLHLERHAAAKALAAIVDLD